MSKNDKLLSIGEVSKYTGAGIKALRYYERINLLKPAFVDPYSGYRYYSFGQTYLVSLIMFCVELDIPLKELTKFIDEHGTIDFKAFLSHGKKVADEKTKVLKRGLRFINVMERAIALQEEHSFEQTYTRDLPEKYYHLIPFEKTFVDVDQFEITKLWSDVPYDEYEDYEWLEYGLLCQHSPSGTERYVFIERPKGKENPECKIIPGGKFYCRQSSISQIEQAVNIFSDYLADKSSYTAIEVEVFSGKVDANKPINELRVMGW
jgi:DNA-binding transcriptional MerR regulator